MHNLIIILTLVKYMTLPISTRYLFSIPHKTVSCNYCHTQIVQNLKHHFTTFFKKINRTGLSDV